jgi:DNA-binding XRE family transcriptional regulator
MLSINSCDVNKVKPPEPELTGNIVAWLNPGMVMPRPTSSSLEAIADRLVASREALEISQVDLCKRCGLKTNAYNQYETATSRINVDAAQALCDNLGYTLDWIYRGVINGLPFDLATKIAQRQALGRTPKRRAR